MIMPKKGVLTKRQPTERENLDMEFGFKMAKALGGLDIGQTVVVKDKVRPASITKPEAFTSIIDSIVFTPTAGISKRLS